MQQSENNNYQIKEYLCRVEYQIVQSEVSMDKCDFVIIGWQILHQPIGEIIHGWNVPVGCSSVLLCPGGHL